MSLVKIIVITILILLSILAYYAGDHARALELRHASVELSRPLGDRWLLGIALTNLAESTQQAGDNGVAERLLVEAVTAALELDARDCRTVQLEGALDTDTVRDLPHRERGVEATVAPSDHDPVRSPVTEYRYGTQEH